MGFQVVSTGNYTAVAFASGIAVYNDTASACMAMGVDPSGQQYQIRIEPGETRTIVQPAQPNVSFMTASAGAGVSATFGAGVIGGNVQAVIDQDGIATFSATAGVGVLLRFTVYHSTDGDTGLCWSPGVDVGIGAGGASGGASFCIGTQSTSVSLGGSVEGGGFTAEGSLTIVQVQY